MGNIKHRRGTGHLVVKVWEDGSFTYETITSQNLNYVTDKSIPNVMGYDQAQLKQLEVDNLKGYPKETRVFLIQISQPIQQTLLKPIE